MNHKLLISLLVLTFFVFGCSNDKSELELKNKQTAEIFFRGVYGGDPSVIKEFATEEIVLSYPIFQTLFNSPVVSGSDAVTNFVQRFSNKWKEPEISIEETVAEGDVVVLVWTFSAFDAFAENAGDRVSPTKVSWGGITVYHFNENGKISLEFGEESEPGPTARLSTN